MPRLKNKVIIVTGAAEGIGKGIANCCVKEAAKVLLVDINPEVQKVASLMGAEALVLDITEANSANQARDFALQQFGKINGLVNNAGRVDEANIMETSDELWQQTMALNLDAPFRWIKAMIPAMQSADGGAIINISSIEATHVRPRHFPYVVSKSGLNCLTRAVAVDLGREGIRCNTISPGSIDTEMYERYTAQYPGLKEHLVGLNFAGRLGTTDEIGAAAVYLLSDETQFLNGHELVIDGARTVAT
jgi:meso-butanediol dehydrogenase/(S,S)-butanediol dehydrogenase/diacetyl reductase